MTQDEIIEMARQAGFHDHDFPFKKFKFEAFAKLVAAKEREACAKVCEPKTPRPCDCESCDCGNSTSARMVAEWDESASIVKAIRARSEATSRGEA